MKPKYKYKLTVTINIKKKKKTLDIIKDDLEEWERLKRSLGLVPTADTTIALFYRGQHTTQSWHKSEIGNPVG